jgi:hypothetical protein
MDKKIKDYLSIFLALIFLTGCVNDESTSSGFSLGFMVLAAVISIYILIISLSEKKLKTSMIVNLTLYVLALSMSKAFHSFGDWILTIFAYSPLLLFLLIIPFIRFKMKEEKEKNK